MSNMNKETKRYQNPEIFEQLAIEYAVGGLQGRARKRFEALMDTHFYLQAVVEAYEHKFAHLVELLPEANPSDKVWNKIESHIKSSASATQAVQNVQMGRDIKTSWWQGAFFKQSFGLAAMVVIVAVVLILNPMTVTPSASAYTAILESDSKVPMAVTKITKSDMSLSIDIMKPVVIADNMELTLWCHPKGSGMPMKMGTISKSGVTKITISKEEWKSMKNVGVLAISVEKKGDLMIRQPTGRILLKGELSTANLN